jgi:hypothetical protein
MTRTPLATLCILSIAIAAAPARADETFEVRSKGAQRIHRLENMVWALTAACDKGDDIEQRQCRHVRDARAAEITATTLLVDADADAFDTGSWSAAKKSLALTLTECIRCAGVEVDGKTWYLTATATPHFDAGKLRTGMLHDNGLGFADEAAAKAWIGKVTGAKVQLLVKVPTKPRWSVDGKDGLAFDVIGYRVYVPCDGSIVLSKPSSAGTLSPDPKQCAATEPTNAKPEAPKLDELTPDVIQEALKPVADGAAQCFEQLGVAGKAKLRITIAGDGSISKYEQQGDLAGTPTGECIDKLVKTVTFPASRRARTTINFPIVLP